MNKAALRVAAGLLLALTLGACSGPGPQFTILSGSENDVLEPMVQEFCQSRRAACTVKYQGSLDIALALKAGNDPGADAVWPAASIWVEVLATVRGLLRGVERSSGSSGWLADLYREGERTGARYEAMWNYEAVIKETNDRLIADKKEPLYAIYPEDGVSVGDSPLGFVDRGRGKEVESFFTDLQAFLLKGDTQARIAATGRRVELGRAAPIKADPTTSLDPSRALTVVRPPEPAVIQKALSLYQEAPIRRFRSCLRSGSRFSILAKSHPTQADVAAFRFLHWTRPPHQV